MTSISHRRSNGLSVGVEQTAHKKMLLVEAYVLISNLASIGIRGIIVSDTSCYGRFHLFVIRKSRRVQIALESSPVDVAIIDR